MTIIWSDDGSTIYTTMSKHGDEPLVAISVANGAATWLIENEVVGPFGLVDGASTIAYLGGSTSDPGNIRLHTNGASKPLTQHNKWIAKAAHCPIEEVWYEARDGYKLQAGL